MILVLCGTQKQDFSRMINKVLQLAESHEIVVQSGHTAYVSGEVEIFDFLPASKLDVLYKRADIIITHAGAGSMFTAIKAGKKVLAFPRLAKFNEHVDDHQLQLAKKLEELGFLMVFNEDDDMISIYEQLVKFEPKPYDLTGNIVCAVDGLIANVLG